MSDSAVLLVNLGSPDSTSTKDVRRYLREFLSDDRVLDTPKPLQQFVLNCFILPTRPRRSAKAYREIWTDEGSPLMVTSRAVQAKVQSRFDLPVELAMRYGKPAIASTMEELHARGIRRIYLVPLYPHYAMSSYETVVARVMEVARRLQPSPKVDYLQPFYNDPEYIEALYQSARPWLEKPYDHLLFSYHGIPVRHLRKADSSKAHCTKVPDCCLTCSPAHATCYKAQVTATTLAFAERAGLDKEKYSIAFQSRLAGEPWLQPYTDMEIKRFAEEGIRNLLVITPAFVSDCLETLEEIGMGGKEIFEEAGGHAYAQIPCLNEHPLWIDFLQHRIEGWLEASEPHSPMVPATS